MYHNNTRDAEKIIQLTMKKKYKRNLKFSFFNVLRKKPMSS